MTEESRAYLQARLIVLSRLMFWSFVSLVVYITLLYRVYPEHEPRLNGIIDVISVLGLGLLASIWRLALARRELTSGQLQFIDTFYSVGTGTIFGASGLLAYDLRSSAYICVSVACLMVLLRAVVVPSTGRRTAIIGIATCLPITFATIALPYVARQEVPGPAYVSGELVICTGAIALATISSQISFGLR